MVAAHAALTDTSSVSLPPLLTLPCPSTAKKGKRQVSAAVGVCPPSPVQHSVSVLSVGAGTETTQPVVPQCVTPAAHGSTTDASVVPLPTLVNVSSAKKSKKSVSAAVGVCPDSLVQDISVIGFDGTVFESVQHCSQSSVCDDGITTNTAVSVQRRMTGSLAGATFSNCTLNINVYK